MSAMRWKIACVENMPEMPIANRKKTADVAGSNNTIGVNTPRSHDTSNTAEMATPRSHKIGNTAEIATPRSHEIGEVVDDTT